MNMFEEIFGSPDTLAWLRLLVDVTTKAVVVLSLSAVVACFLMRRASSASRHLVWLLAIGVVIAAPAMTPLFPNTPLFTFESTSAAFAMATPSIVEQPVIEQPIVGQLPAVQEREAAPESRNIPFLQQPLSPADSEVQNSASVDPIVESERSDDIVPIQTADSPDARAESTEFDFLAWADFVKAMPNRTRFERQQRANFDALLKASSKTPIAVTMLDLGPVFAMSDPDPLPLLKLLATHDDIIVRFHALVGLVVATGQENAAEKLVSLNDVSAISADDAALLDTCFKSTSLDSIRMDASEIARFLSSIRKSGRLLPEYPDVVRIPA